MCAYSIESRLKLYTNIFFLLHRFLQFRDEKVESGDVVDWCQTWFVHFIKEATRITQKNRRNYFRPCNKKSNNHKIIKIAKTLNIIVKRTFSLNWIMLIQVKLILKLWMNKQIFKIWKTQLKIYFGNGLSRKKFIITGMNYWCIERLPLRKIMVIWLFLKIKEMIICKLAIVEYDKRKLAKCYAYHSKMWTVIKQMN
jgi:hypothetical protein